MNKCWRCGGTGDISEGGDWWSCPDCNGRGFTYSDKERIKRRNRQHEQRHRKELALLAAYTSGRKEQAK